MDLKALRELRFEADVVIAAAEDWATGYRKTPKAFKLLVRSDRRLYDALVMYLKGASGRIQTQINWYRYNQHTIKAADAEDDYTDTIKWEVEQEFLLKVVFPELKMSYTIGLDAGYEATSFEIGVSKVSEYAYTYASEHGGELVKGLNKTTLDEVRRSIQTSLKLRENDFQAADRLNAIIDNPERALQIARTESVNAYSAAMTKFAQESSATSKYWQTASNPCPVCEKNATDGNIGVNEQHSSGDLAPTAHPGCACNEVYNYNTPPDA